MDLSQHKPYMLIPLQVTEFSVQRLWGLHDGEEYMVTELAKCGLKGEEATASISRALRYNL